MEDKSPYRIYDPGGTAPSFFTVLRKNMDGVLSLGNMLEESKNAATNLRVKAEALAKDTQELQSSISSNIHTLFPGQMQAEQPGGREQVDDFLHVQMKDRREGDLEKNSQKTPPSGTSSEFEILDHSEKRKMFETRNLDPGPSVQNEDENIHCHLQRMENSLSMFAEESDQNRLINHMSRMALEFNRLANKVHKNDMKTTVLQTLCEQLRKENEDLRSKLEADWKQRSQVEQALRYENLELKKVILDKAKTTTSGSTIPSTENTTIVDNTTHVQAAKLHEKTANKDQSGVLLKKVKILEHQRTELLEVNKQWDQQFRSMKMQYEEKITSLRQKVSQAAKNESEQEVEKDRKQRDFDRKLLLARDKIEEKQSQNQKLESEMRDLKQKNKVLHEQLSSISKQREYQEREISRLNKALEDALKVKGSGPRSPSSPVSTTDNSFLQCQELLTQVELLKQQVTIFEEDFKRERSDRERMNEEKEELKTQLEQLQTQLRQANNQLRSCQDDLRREKDHSRELARQQASGDCPPYQYPYSPPGLMYPAYDDWQICYPPPVVAPEHSQVQELPNAPPPAYQWRAPNVPSRHQNQKRTDIPKPRKEPDGPKR